MRINSNAALVDFDMDVMQDEIMKALRRSLGASGAVLDAFELEDSDPSAVRYSS